MAGSTRIAAVEAGGTSFVVAIAEGDPTNIVDRADFSTTTPEVTLGKVVAWLKEREFDCLGVASFGPIELHPTSPRFGFITTTPKPHWTNADILAPLRKGLGLPEDYPIGFETDVNAPAMAEYSAARDKGQGLESCAYVTVGTGVGIGLVFGGHPVHGLLHGEGGHISVPRFPGDTWEGKQSLNCPGWYELESMVNSAALAGRAGCEIPELKDLPDEHPVWDTAAHYLAAMCANLILTVSPQKIVLSGGVMLRSILFPKIRAKTQEYLNNYIDVPEVTTDRIDKVIVPSDHGNRAGIIGALYIARGTLTNHKAPSCSVKVMGHTLCPGAITGILTVFGVGAILGAVLAKGFAR